MSESRRAKRVAKNKPKRGRGPLLATLVILAAAIIAAGLWAWHAFGRSRGQPDILLISIDTLRADRLGCYDYAIRHTPNIDRLAAGGIVFDAVTSPIPITLPSHSFPHS